MEFDQLKDFHEWLTRAQASITTFWADKVAPVISSLPPIVLVIFRIVLAVAALNVLIAFGVSITKNYDQWKGSSVEGLMQGYFSGTGQYQRKLIYSCTRSLAWDHKWSVVSFAGLAYRFGIISIGSQSLMFLCSLAYLPLTALGIVEMIGRGVIGFVFTFAMGIAHWAILVVLGLVAWIIRPIIRMVDKAKRIDQHCPTCFSTFNVPFFVCPRCGRIHESLLPGKIGLLIGRCECGKFLPVSVLSGRSKLQAMCPKCNGSLAAANARQFSVELIGGNSSGKTAYLASFAHEYVMKSGATPGLNVFGRPISQFDELEGFYQSGQTIPSSSTTTFTYSFVHSLKGKEKHSLAIYDIPDEALMNGSYERNPLNLGYADGVILIVDPLSISSIRSECEETMPMASFTNKKLDDPDMIIVEFIHLLSKITGRSSKKMLNIPVAVVINKTDIKFIRREIGRPKIKSTFSANPARYGNDFATAQNDICREYLSKYGLSNALNNLESVFSNVRYFPVSATGEYQSDGIGFSPIDILNPVAWLTREAGSPLSKFFAAINTQRSDV